MSLKEQNSNQEKAESQRIQPERRRGGETQLAESQSPQLNQRESALLREIQTLRFNQSMENRTEFRTQMISQLVNLSHLENLTGLDENFERVVSSLEKIGKQINQLAIQMQTQNELIKRIGKIEKV